MKRLYALLAAGAVLVSLAGCGMYEDDRTGTPDTFPVEDVLTEDGTPVYRRTGSFFKDGELAETYESTFDEHDNLLTDSVTYITAGEADHSVSWKHRYSYDESGNILLDCCCLGEKLGTVSSHEYNGDGTEKLCVTYEPDRDGGSTLVKSFYRVNEYDGRGNVAESFEYDFFREIPAEDIFTYSYEFDGNGNILTMRFSLKDSTAYDLHTYTYDSGGHMLTETVERVNDSGKNKSRYVTKEYEYDFDGDIVKERTYQGQSQYETTYEYDEKKRITHEYSSNSETVYEYEEL